MPIAAARASAGALIAWLLLTSCGAGPSLGTPLRRRGDEVVACGAMFHTGSPVVLWMDPGGYDAYRLEPRFSASSRDGPTMGAKARYGPHRRGLPEAMAERVERDGWRLEDLNRAVRMLVLHYDSAGTSRQCFKVLHDVRGLSAHFLLDLDGTIYQTLDLKERAWHAGDANDASIGIEIANIGAYSSPNDANLREWYRTDAQGPLVAPPRWIVEPGLRTPGFTPRPARPDLIRGEVHGRTLYQYDFTDAQYRALARLLAALHRVLPRIRLDAPRDANGAVLRRTMSEYERSHFEGVVGHWHLTERKVDPGPAFDWDRLFRDARALH